jgi:hypothetical protein
MQWWIEQHVDVAMSLGAASDHGGMTQRGSGCSAVLSSFKGVNGSLVKLLIQYRNVSRIKSIKSGGIFNLAEYQ